MFVPASGPAGARYAIVGEAPGASERKYGKPFVGPSGQLLRDALQRVGLDPDEAYITNVYQEYREGNPTPTPAEVAANRARLQEELAALPNLQGVLLLGNTPLRAFTGRTGITKQRGVHESELCGVPVFATLHPAAILRTARYKSAWLNDISSFAASVNNVKEEVQVYLVWTEAGLVTMQEAMYAADYVGALDIETTINDRMDRVKIMTVGVSFDGKTSYVLPYDSEVFDAGLRLLQDGLWIMHNGAFDRTMLHRLTPYRYELWQDTMAMQYLLHPDEQKGLQVLSGVYLGLPPYKDIDYTKIEETPMKALARMNGRDAARTYLLYFKLRELFETSPLLERTYDQLLLPAIRMLSDITVRGVPVDRERLTKLQLVLEEEKNKAELVLAELAGEPLPEWKEHWPGKEKRFNPGSPQQVAHVLFDKMDYPVLKRTDSGAPSTDADTLSRLSEWEPSEFLDALISYRIAAKGLSAFVDSWSKLIESDGRLHPRYKATQVVTGRIASEKPNIQQVPRTHEFRSVFGGVKGFTWVKADLSQIELRIAAYLAQEENMLEAYRNGEDLHTLTAERVLGSSSPEARQVGKTLNFGLLYGAYPAKLMEVARRQYGLILTKQEAEEYRALFFESYPRLAEWHSNTKAEVRSRGYSVSPLGRVRMFPEVNDPDEWVVRAAEREAINHPVQSFASDILLSGLIRMPTEVSQYAIAEVHDEVDFLIPDAEVERSIPIIKAYMEETGWLESWNINLNVPVVAEVEAKGEYWS